MSTVEFFNQGDFDQLIKFAGQPKSNDNPEMLSTYNYLKGTYNKVEHWAREVQNKLFPNGQIHILKKPTNQANIFQEYQWAKIYPDDKSWDVGKLAITVGINTELNFDVKIDTVGLGERDDTRKMFLKERGDFNTSPIVKIYKSETILKNNWDYLINLTLDSVKELKPSFDKILISLFGQNTFQATMMYPNCRAGIVDN